MIIHKVTQGSNVKKVLIQDYEAILNDAPTELSEAEFKHLNDIASIGYEHALQKDEYIEALHDTITEWAAEARRKAFYCTQSSTEIDFLSWYNKTSEVKEPMQANQKFSTIPTFFVWFGAVVLALFCISATVFVMGICQNAFLVNPVYLFMFCIGFLGLLLTDIVAIAEWRNAQNVQK